MKFTYICNNCPQLSITESVQERLRLHGENVSYVLQIWKKIISLGYRKESQSEHISVFRVRSRYEKLCEELRCLNDKYCR